MTMIPSTVRLNVNQQTVINLMLVFIVHKMSSTSVRICAGLLMSNVSKTVQKYTLMS